MTERNGMANEIDEDEAERLIEAARQQAAEEVKMAARHQNRELRR